MFRCFPSFMQKFNILNIDAEISKLESSIRSKPKDVVALGKRFLNEQVEMDVASAFRCVCI
jgi:hypothetical protein